MNHLQQDLQNNTSANDTMLEKQFAKGALEAILMVAVEPVPAQDLAKAINLEPDLVEQLLSELSNEYSCESYPRGFQLRKIAGGWRFYSHPHYSDIVLGFVTSGQQNKLSAQALETLAVIAYRQPVTRAQIAAIRGVDVDSVVRTLQMRGLVEQIGATPDRGAALYQTTSYFLERMGLNSLDDLPDLAPYLPDNDVLDEIEKEIR